MSITLTRIENKFEKTKQQLTAVSLSLTEMRTTRLVTRLYTLNVDWLDCLIR